MASANHQGWVTKMSMGTSRQQCRAQDVHNATKNALRLIGKNRSRLLRLAGEGGWILAGQIASVLGSLLLVRTLTQYMPPEQYGELALGLTVVGLAQQVALGGIIAGIGRFYTIADQKGDLWPYIRASVRLLIYGSLGVGFLFLVLMFVLLITEQVRWLPLVAAALIFSILSGYNSALNNIQNAARQRAIVALHGGIDAWLKIGLVVLLFLWIGVSTTSVVIGFVMSTFFVTASQFFFLNRLLHQRGCSTHRTPENEWGRQIWLFSWPIMVSGIFNWGYYASQRWALELFVSTGEVGKFYALTQIAYTPIITAGSLFMSFMLPILFARAGDAGNQERISNVRWIVYRIAALGIGATVFLGGSAALLHQPIFRLLVAEQYRDASVYMPTIIVAASLLQVSQTLAVYVFAQNKTHLLLPINIIGNSIAAMLNFSLAWRYGFNGLIASLVAGAAIHLIWMAVIVLELKPISWAKLTRHPQ